jgi:hypothetical protein
MWVTREDLRAEQREVIVSAIAGAIFCASVLAAGSSLLRRYFTFPNDFGGALAFVLRADLFIALWVVVAIRMVSRIRFRSSADNAGSAFSTPSPQLRIPAAFLQNTLEQAFIAVVAHLALATLVAGPALSLAPPAVLLFAVGRVAFLRGYPKGAGGRAFGMVLTMFPTILAYLWAVALIGAELIP